MKKISEQTIEQLRGISPDALAAHGIIAEAPNHKGRNGYCCLLCGSGEGRNHHGRQGTGGGAFDADNRFFCYSCQNESVGRHKLSTIDLFSLARGLQHENFAERCRKMAREFNVGIDFDELPDLPRRRRSATTIAAKPAATPAKKKSDEELKLIREDLSATDDALINFVRDNGGTWRDLPAEILQKHGCKFAERWTPPTSRAENKYATPTPRVLIPFDGKTGYLARLTVPIETFDDDAQKYIKPKQNAGTVSLFNTDVLNDAPEPVFIVEGTIDAMSIELAGFKACALNGRGNGDLLVDAVNKMTSKPKIIILLDADAAGRKSAPNLRDDLIDIGCPCVVRFLSDDVSKIDANEILTTSSVDVLRGKLQSIFDDSQAELDAVADELAKRHEEEKISAEDLDFLFSGDASDLDFARRFERIFGNHVRWLSDEERWLVYGSGVWTRGGTTNSCVQPFARNVGDIMSRHAQNDDERKLADRLKNSRKVSTSITMMKSLDSILITQDDLDNHAELLNVANGVVNLQDGKLYPHDSSLLLTQQCRADFDANATSPLVEKFFHDIQPDEQTCAGLLRWLGYCLTAETREDKFAIWTGERGANGKSTLSTTILELLNNYGVGLLSTALLKNNRGYDAERATASLNGIEGKRFAVSEEIPQDGELDSSRIKDLTGGNKITLRRLHAEARTIQPTAKINILGNFAPRLENAHDGGIRRRLLNFAFNVQFGVDKPADSLLKMKLIQPENLRGLLSILVREAVAWYRGTDGGLIISDAMKAETQRHLNQSDFIAEFVDENFVLAPNASVKAKDFLDELKRAYSRECSRFNRSDLIRLVERAAGVTYCEDRKRNRIFKGIGKLANSDFDGEPVNPSETAMP